MLKTQTITGKILLKSGLHIGGSKDTMQIGGIDNPVIKNSLTNLPYIPGSSLKGKMRFLLEHYYGLVKSGDLPKVDEKGENDWEFNKIAAIFGHMEHDKISTKPTRVIFADGNILGVMDESGKLENDLDKLKEKMLADFVEAKMEVAIDRITGTAKGGALRTIERVPAGVVFNLEVILKIYGEDDDKENLDILLKGLKLLQNDALGGSGSRGSGRIEILDLKVGEEEKSLAEIKL